MTQLIHTLSHVIIPAPGVARRVCIAWFDDDDVDDAQRHGNSSFHSAAKRSVNSIQQDRHNWRPATISTGHWHTARHLYKHSVISYMRHHQVTPRWRDVLTDNGRAGETGWQMMSDIFVRRGHKKTYHISLQWQDGKACVHAGWQTDRQTDRQTVRRLPGVRVPNVTLFQRRQLLLQRHTIRHQLSSAYLFYYGNRTKQRRKP